MFSPCIHMKITQSDAMYCSPPHLENVSHLLEHQDLSICLKCPSYEAMYTQEELVELEQLLETNKKEDE